MRDIKLRKRLFKALAGLMASVMIISCIPVLSLAAPSAPAELSGVAQYLQKSESLSSDGRIGIPVNVHTYYDSTKTYTSGGKGSNVALYVMNTNTERVGTDADSTIIADLISRDFFVIVVDYLDNAKACGQELTWSVQGIRVKVGEGNYSNGQLSSDVRKLYIVPEGYNVETDIKYFSIDEFGSAGSLEHIVDMWKADFASIHADDIMTVDGEEMTVAEYTAQFNDENPMTIYDCLKPDGTMIDLNLYMDYIYPTNPENDVPVMLHKSSSETRAGRSIATIDRPHLNPFLFSGYAAVIADYEFVPMSRDDQYGAFQGTGMEGSVTGVNTTYSMDLYDGLKADTALMRAIRKSADPTDPNREYKFNVNKIGVFGNSKGGHIFRLAHPDPNSLDEFYEFEGHDGETRYEAIYDSKYAWVNYTDPYLNDEVNNPNNSKIRAPKQPENTTYSDGTKIPENANLVYPSVGMGEEALVEGSSPIFNVGTVLTGGSYEYIYNPTKSATRAMDIPSIHLVCPDLGHTFGSGIDRDYGVDVLDTFVAMCDYYLKDAPAELLYIHGEEDFAHAAQNKIMFTFTGAVAENEISKITIKNDSTGDVLNGIWTSEFGGHTWYFAPTDLASDSAYTITVPDTIKTVNGNNIATTYTEKFNSAVETEAAGTLNGATTVTTNDAAYVVFPEVTDETATNFDLRFNVTNDAANVVEVYTITSLNESNYSASTVGYKIGEVGIAGAGTYSVDVTGFVKGREGKVAFKLVAKNTAGANVITTYDGEGATNPLATGLIKTEIVNDSIPNGNGKAYKLDYKLRDSVMIDLTNNLIGNTVGNKTTFMTISDGFGQSSFSAADVGRRFRVSFRAYDTRDDRLVRVLRGQDNEASGYYYALETKKDDWVSYSTEFQIKEPGDWRAANTTSLRFITDPGGSATIPENVAVKASGFAAGTLGASKGSMYVGTQGLLSSYTKYADVEAAEAAGVVTVKKSEPLYIDDIKFEEIVTDVGVSSPKMVGYVLDEYNVPVDPSIESEPRPESYYWNVNFNAGDCTNHGTGAGEENRPSNWYAEPQIHPVEGKWAYESNIGGNTTKAIKCLADGRLQPTYFSYVQDWKKVVFSANVYVPQYTEDFSMVVTYANASEGNITQTANIPATAYTAKKWTPIRVVADMQAKTFKIFVNNALYDTLTIPSDAVQFKSMFKLMLKGGMYVDDFKIYEAPASTSTEAPTSAPSSEPESYYYKLDFDGGNFANEGTINETAHSYNLSPTYAENVGSNTTKAVKISQSAADGRIQTGWSRAKMSTGAVAYEVDYYLTEPTEVKYQPIDNVNGTHIYVTIPAGEIPVNQWTTVRTVVDIPNKSVTVYVGDAEYEWYTLPDTFVEHSTMVKVWGFDTGYIDNFEVYETTSEPKSNKRYISVNFNTQSLANTGLQGLKPIVAYYGSSSASDYLSYHRNIAGNTTYALMFTEDLGNFRIQTSYARNKMSDGFVSVSADLYYPAGDKDISFELKATAEDIAVYKTISPKILAGDYPTNGWFNVRIDFDTEKHQYQMYVDGVKYGSAVSYEAEYTQISEMINLYGFKGLYVDDFVVYESEAEPIVEPTVAPTVAPTATPTVAPTVAPTATPTVAPTATPTTAPSGSSTPKPTAEPSSYYYKVDFDDESFTNEGTTGVTANNWNLSPTYKSNIGGNTTKAVNISQVNAEGRIQTGWSREKMSTGVVAYEVDYYLTEPTEVKYQPVDFVNGTHISVTIPAGEIPVNQWTTVRTVVDIPNKSVTVYVGGFEYEWYALPDTFEEHSTLIKVWGFENGYIDNFEVYETTSEPMSNKRYISANFNKQDLTNTGLQGLKPIVAYYGSNSASDYISYHRNIAGNTTYALMFTEDLGNFRLQTSYARNKMSDGFVSVSADLYYPAGNRDISFELRATAEDTSKYVSIQPKILAGDYPTNGWFNVRIDFDTEKNQYQMYIDDVKYGIAVSYEAEYIQISELINLNGFKGLYVDNFMAYESEAAEESVIESILSQLNVDNPSTYIKNGVEYTFVVMASSIIPDITEFNALRATDGETVREISLLELMGGTTVTGNVEIGILFSDVKAANADNFMAKFVKND